MISTVLISDNIAKKKRTSLRSKGLLFTIKYTLSNTIYLPNQTKINKQMNNNSITVNYDTFIRNNTIPCNFLDYDNLLSEDNAKTDDQFNHTKLKAFKTVLANEDLAFNNLVNKQPHSLNLEEYTTEELLEYKSFLKSENEEKTQELNNLDQEFNKIYMLKELLMDKLIDVSLSDNESTEDSEENKQSALKTLETVVVKKLISKLDDTNEDMISLLNSYIS